VFPDDWTVNDLLGKHRSRPYNPLIANTFFRAGYIESWGRGIEKIKESCIENGNEMAEYQVRPSEVMVVFYGLHDVIEKQTKQATQDNTQDDTQDNIQDNTQDISNKEKEQRILSYCEIPRSKKEIADYLGYKTIKSIKAEIATLLIEEKIEMTIPDKPKSKNQKYIATKK
jgi:ATP-dependent DNA helicase RecG